MCQLMTSKISVASNFKSIFHTPATGTLQSGCNCAPMYFPCEDLGWQSSFYLEHCYYRGRRQRHTKCWCLKFWKIIYATCSYIWQKSVTWQSLPLMGLGSKILPKGRVSNICEQSHTVSITYCNCNGIFIIICFPCSTLRPMSSLFNTLYSMPHRVFGIQ